MSRLLYLLYRNIPLAYYGRASRTIAPGSTLLEVGSGMGHLLLAVEKKYDYLVGVDIDEKLVGQAKRSGRIDMVVGSGCHLPFRDSSFETVVFHDSLHHLEDPVRGLEEGCRVLAARGSLYIYDFDLNSAAVKLLRFVEKAVGFPAKFVRKTEIVNLVERCATVQGLSHSLYGGLELRARKTFPGMR